MPELEALVRWALRAHERSEALALDSQRVRPSRRLLRQAGAGETLLLRCAWCQRLCVGDEWLHLVAVGTQEQHIASALTEGATHGICPTCFKAQMSRANDLADKSAAEDELPP